MIVRILGEGQFRLEADDMEAVNAADSAVEAALASGDQDALAAALRDLAEVVRRVGDEVPIDEFVGSDVVIPGEDATLEEVQQIMGDEGLVPG